MSLEVTDLVVRIDGRPVVDGVSFEVPDGSRLGLIGESGSGKSLTALAVLGLLPDGATASGSIRWNGTELIGMPDRELARLRGDEIGIVFQEPRTALNPIRTVGRQIAESIRIHEGIGRREARERAIQEAARVRLPDPDSPIRPRRAPSGTSKEMPSTTGRPSISITRSCTESVMRPPPECGSLLIDVAAWGRSPHAGRRRADSARAR